MLYCISGFHRPFTGNSPGNKMAAMTNVQYFQSVKYLRNPLRFCINFNSFGVAMYKTKFLLLLFCYFLTDMTTILKKSPILIVSYNFIPAYLYAKGSIWHSDHPVNIKPKLSAVLDVYILQTIFNTGLYDLLPQQTRLLASPTQWSCNGVNKITYIMHFSIRSKAYITKLYFILRRTDL